MPSKKIFALDIDFTALSRVKQAHKNWDCQNLTITDTENRRRIPQLQL
jgi:hypothetical protein